MLKDVTAVGILSASPGLDATIAAYAAGAVDPRPLVAATVGLDEVGAVLAGQRPARRRRRARRSTSTRAPAADRRQMLEPSGGRSAGGCGDAGPPPDVGQGRPSV